MPRTRVELNCRSAVEGEAENESIVIKGAP